MVSVRLVSADSYQAQPLPRLDPAFSEFRGSEIKHLPIIRVFGCLPTGEKTCLHIHGVFPYLYVPYTGEEDPASLAYRLAASLDAAINVSLGAASSSTQHVYLIQRVSGIPFYGYHKNEHQYFKIYFYNPAMIKRAADLLQNGSVLNRSLQPHEAHVPYVLQFMMDYNVYGMSMINLREVKHRRITQSLTELGLSGHSGISEISDIDYLPSSVERQSTCELEIDALASDILNRREIERGLDLNPGLAAIWEEERARRAQAGLPDGDSQLVNPKSPPRPTFQPTENDLYQEQRLARRLLMISQCDESTVSTSSSRSLAYAAEVREGENLMNSSSISIPSVQGNQFVPRDDTAVDANLLDSPTIVDSPKLSADCSVLGTDDQPLVDLLAELAGGNENSESVDTDSVLGSQVSLLPDEPRSDNEDEDIPDLNLTSLQLDSLCDSANVQDPSEQLNLHDDLSRDESSSSTFHLSPFLTSCEVVSGSSRSTDDSETQKKTKASSTQIIPQYDGAGDVSPTLLNSSSDDGNDSDSPKNTKEFSHLSKYNGSCEIAAQPRRSETQPTTFLSRSNKPNSQCDSLACDSEGIAERPGSDDRSPVVSAHESERARLSPSSALTSDAYLGQYTGINYEPFDRLLEIGPDFVPDLEGMHSSMEIGILLSSGDSDSPESVIQESDKDTIPLDAVLNGDPCFTESAELDKSDVTELRDQYASLLGNSLLPDVHTNPRIDDDLGSASNFSDSDYQSNEKNCNFSFNAPSPRSAATSRDSSSSSENVTPNIQEPEARSGTKSKLGPSERQEDCKEPRALSDNSDYNCNFVATWAELQNIRQDKRLYRLRNRKTGQWIPGPRQSRRKADRRSLPNITTQLFGRVPESMKFQLAESHHRSPRKVPLSSAVKTPVKKTKNPSPTAYIPAESVAKKIETSEGKLSTSPLPDVARLPELEREETSEESACQPLHTEASLAAFHRSIIGSDNPLAETKKSPENSYSSEAFLESESIVESGLPVFEELSEAEIVELPDRESDIFQGTSHYCSERSERDFSCGCFEHRHCTWSTRQGRIIQDQVFTSDQLYVIEKRKRGKPHPPDKNLCTKSFCKLPFVPLGKLEAETDERIETGLEVSKTEESLISDLTYGAILDPVESVGKPNIFSVDLNVTIPEPNVADRLPKRKSRGRRRRAETGSFDTSNITSTLSSSDEEPSCFASSDWAKDEGRWSIHRITNDDGSQDPYVRKTTKKLLSSEAVTKSRARDSCEIDARTCNDLPGIPGIMDYPKKRARQKRRDEETRVELLKPKKPLRSVLFPNWGAEREISESPNGAPKMISNGFAFENRRGLLSDRRKGRSLKTSLSISPLPNDRKITTNVKPVPENEALNCMIREVKCPSTRAKLKLLIKSRRRGKLGRFRSKRKLSSTGEERESEAKIVTPLISTNSLMSSAIHGTGVTPSKRDADRISYSKIVAVPGENKLQPTNAPDPKDDQNRDHVLDETRVENSEIVEPLDFETPALSVVFDTSGGFFDTETEIIEDSVSKIRSCEESSNDPKLSFRSDKYAISATNFFTASDYTIDAVSLEIPTCLFEEDSNPVEQRSQRRAVQDAPENGNCADDAGNSVDPRDLDVFDAESLTPGSSFSQLVDATESSLDCSELSVSSGVDDWTKSEHSMESRFSPSGKTREDRESACKNTDEELSEESEECNSLSPSPKTSEILGNAPEVAPNSTAENFEKDSMELDEFTEDENSEKRNVKGDGDAKLDEDIDDLVSHIVVRLEDNGGMLERDFLRERVISSHEKDGEESMENENDRDASKEKEISSDELERRKSIMIEDSQEDGPETPKEQEALPIHFSKKKKIWSHEKDGEESMENENDRDASKENEISSDELERRESIMIEDSQEDGPESPKEQEALPIHFSKEKEIWSHEKESEESRTSENDENISRRAADEVELLSVDEEAGIADHEEKQRITSENDSDRLIISKNETEPVVIDEKNEAINSEKNLPIESQLITWRTIKGSIIADKKGIPDNQEPETVDEKEEQRIAEDKNVEALQVAQSKPELQFVNEKADLVDEAIETEKQNIDSETDALPQLITSTMTTQSIVVEKEEMLGAATESNSKYAVDAEKNPQQSLITTMEASEPAVSEGVVNSQAIIIETENISAKTVKEIEPIVAEKNSEPPFTKSEIELPFVDEKVEMFDTRIECENKLSIETENSREPSIARTNEKVGSIISEDDGKSPTTAITETSQPTFFSNNKELLATVSSKEEPHEVARDSMLGTVGEKDVLETQATISIESMKNSSESNDSSRDESAGIFSSKELKGDISKALQVDGNMNDTKTEQRESRLSRQSVGTLRVETRKEPYKCRPVTIKLVSLDLSRISGFGLKSRSKSRVGQTLAPFPSNVEKVPEEVSSVQDGGRKNVRSAKARSQVRRSQPTRKCVGKTKLESKLSDKKTQLECKNLQEERLSEQSGEKIRGCAEENAFQGRELSRDVQEKDDRKKNSSEGGTEKKIKECLVPNGDETGGPEETIRDIETSSIRGGDTTSIEDERSEKSSGVNFEKPSSKSNSLLNNIGSEITDKKSEVLLAEKTDEALSHARRVEAKGKINNRFSCKKSRGRRRRIRKSGSKKIAREISETFRELVPINQEDLAEQSKLGQSPSPHTVRDESANSGTLEKSSKNRELESTNALSPKCESLSQKTDEEKTGLMSLKSEGKERFGKVSEEQVGMLDPELEKPRKKCATNGRFGGKKSKGRRRRVINSSSKNITQQICKTSLESVLMNSKNSAERSCHENDLSTFGRSEILTSSERDAMRRETVEQNVSVISSKPKRIAHFAKRSRKHVDILDSKSKASREKCAEEVEEETSRQKCAEKIEEKMSQELNSPSQESLYKIEAKVTRGFSCGKNSPVEINIMMEDINSRELDSSSTQSKSNVEVISATLRRRGRSGKNSTVNRQDPQGESPSSQEKRTARNLSSQTRDHETIEHKISIKPEKKIRTRRTAFTSAVLRCPENPSLQDKTIKSIAEETFRSERSSLYNCLESEMEEFSKPAKRGRLRKYSVEKAPNSSSEYLSSQEEDEPIESLSPAEFKKINRARKAQTGKIEDSTPKYSSSHEEGITHSLGAKIFAKLRGRSRRRRRGRGRSLVVRKRSLGNPLSRTKRRPDVEENTVEKSELLAQKNVAEWLERKSSNEPRGRDRKITRVMGISPSPDASSSRDEINRNNIESISREPEVPGRGSIAARIKFKSPAILKRNTRVCKSSAVDAKTLQNLDSQDESHRERSENTWREPKVPSWKIIDEDFDAKKKGRFRKSVYVGTKTPLPETPEEISSQKSNDEDIEANSPDEFKKKRRGRKSSAVNNETPVLETASSQQESNRDKTEKPSREHKEILSQNSNDEAIGVKNSDELKKRRGRINLAVDNKTPSLPTTSSKEERDSTNSSQDPEQRQRITDENIKQKSPVRRKRKGRGRKRSVTKKTQLAKIQSQREGDRNVMKNASVKPDFPPPESSLSMIIVDEKMEPKTLDGVENKNRAGRSRGMLPNHPALPETNRHETTVTKSAKTPAGLSKLAKEKISTKTLLTSKKRTHISYDLEVDDLDSIPAKSVSEVTNRPLESSPLPLRNCSVKSPAENTSPGFEELSLKNPKLVVDRNSLPTKRVRFDEVSIRRTGKVILTDAQPKETGVEQPSSKRHHRLSPKLKPTEANFTGVDDKRSRVFSETDWISSEAVFEFCDSTLTDQTENTFNPSDHKLVDGANGLRENKKLKFNFRNNFATDLWTLQEVSRKISEPDQIPKTAPMETGHESTTENSKWSRERIRLGKPVVILKRLSQDSLRSHGYAFRSETKKFVKIFKKSSIDDFRLPAYDGAADLTSSDSDEETNVTIVSDEKRVCIYQSGKKSAASRRDAIVTPNKRKLDEADDDSAGPSSKRRTRATKAETPKKSSHCSPSRTSMLRSPGRLSGFYSPLKIIVTSPKVRKDTPESRETLRPENRDATVLSSGSITPRRKGERLHESFMRGRISATKSSGKELGARHEFRATTMTSERSGELDGIASVGHKERGSVKSSAGTISNEPIEAPRIAKDSRDVRKRLVFLSTGNESGAAKSNESVDEPKEESRKLNAPSKGDWGIATINEAEELIDKPDNSADRGSTMSAERGGPSRWAKKMDDRDPYDVTTDEENENDDEAFDCRLSQYVGGRSNDNRTFLDQSEPNLPSSWNVLKTIETCATPKNRDKESIESSDNLTNPKSRIFVPELENSCPAPKMDDQDFCDAANDKSIANDDEAIDVTFSQYINSRMIENRSLLDESKIDSNSNDERIVVRPKFDPPSRSSVVETMETYGIPRHCNQEPFFSVDADVPRQKELAYRTLKVPGKSLKDVPAFVSSVDGITGIARWRKMKIMEFIPSLTRSNDVEVKIALCSNDKVTLTPLVRPPTRKEAQDWLRAREYLKKKKDEGESRRNKLEEKGKINTGAAEIKDRSRASHLSAVEPSPESTGCKSKQEREPNPGLTMRLAKRGLLERVKETTGRETRHGSEEEIEVVSQRAGGIGKGSGDSNSTEIDPSLLSVLGKSRLFREQEASRQLGVSYGQIEFLSDSTRSNIDNENLQNAKALTRYQYLTIMCLEVHVTTRGDLLPDAQYDSIAAIFYSVQSDVPPTSTIKPLEHGVIVVAETDKAKNKMYYSYASKFPWSISFAHNEEALLNSLVNLITRVDPEILIGWELETLSWGYVFQRASIMGMNLYKRISRIPATQGKWEVQPRDIETLAEVKLPGRIVLDIWRLMRHEAALLSYTFESMMHHVLNERVPCPSFKTLTDWWNLERPRPFRWRVVEHYSIRILGVFRILDQLDIIGRTSELARLFGIQFFEVFSRGSQYRVESVMLRLAKPLNYIAVSPSTQQRASMRAMEALPLIMEPESMFYSDPLIVLDFQSLYPSIIIAHNYCFSTCLGRIEHIGQPEPFEFGAYTLRVPKSTSLKLQGKVNFAPCGVAFVKPEVCLGVLPRMLTEILDTRFMVKKAMKDHKRDDKTLQRALHSRQMGLKFLANVTYGYTAANFSGRMPCIEVGDSVVSKSKETLERAIKLVESTPKWGARVVYGDTDSLFILVPGKSKADAFVIGDEIADAVTAANPPPIKLKFEKVVYPGILQTKKRYCGYMYETPEQENPTYLAKGIETVRRDGCPAVSKILEKTLKILFETKDVSLVKKYVTRQLDKVLRGKVSIRDLTFAKEFRGLKGYKAKACVPALELTKRLMKKDPRAVPRNSERVRYVIVAGAPNQALIHCVRTPWELINDPGLRPNGIYYVTRVIVPPLNRCLNLMGVDVNAWYREMPHRHILDNPIGQRGDRQKLTIFQYFGTIVCAVCGQSSNKGICTECLANPPDALVVLHDKLRRLDRTDSHVTAICQSCVGQADVADCASLDCPVLYRRAQAQRELTQATHLRAIIECGNKLEL